MSEHHEHDHHHIDSPEKLKALLSHMLEHNQSHTNELESIIKALKEQSNDEAAKNAEEAVKEYEKGNALL
nr:hypothetical protein [Butyrivibrio sp.]